MAFKSSNKAAIALSCAGVTILWMRNGQGFGHLIGINIASRDEQLTHQCASLSIRLVSMNRLLRTSWYA
ncbi:MAG: hypothetical protein IPN53_17445 [Comamonadaceae bacterium]|nr:hypothetical protein [Comamonadaceae bacterium]